MAIRKSVDLPANRVLNLSVGNLLEEPVDAIVNAANGNLAHGGGVAAAISRAAGPELDHESSEYVKKRGPVPTGQAAVTTAGKLPFKGVIHAVGPRQGEGNEHEKLANAVIASLKRAGEKGWSSIAMPAISSGIFSVPLETCASAYIQGVKRYFDDHPDTSVREVFITIFEGPLVELVEKEMDRL